MIKFFETVDVFTGERFGGNPLAVFVDAQGMTAAMMQSLAAEMNLSETTFVLPPQNPENTARVRIFHRTAEMPFAGHPMIGTAYVLARRGLIDGDVARFEVPAGIARVQLERNPAGAPTGGRVKAPRPLSTGAGVSPFVIALCLGLDAADIVTTTHAPLLASAGNPYIIAELTEAALVRCRPNLAEFERAAAHRPDLNGRFSIHVYAREGADIHARMFAPLAGTWEDPATGSANIPLGALLLSLTDRPQADYVVRQGREMGRPSLLQVTATRTNRGIIASVGGQCVPMFAGEFHLSIAA